MRSRCTFNQHIAFLNDVTVLNNQTTSLRNEVFPLFTVISNNNDTLFSLVVFTEFNHTVHIRDDCRILRLTSFKQLGNTRQTTGNIF